MIISLNGKITGLFSDKVILEVSGVGYECFISQQTYNYLINKNEKNKIKLNIYHHINESNQCLFGFSDLEEKTIFMLLISVSGIGPKTAIQFLSNTTVKDSERKIIEGKVKELTSIPGIGPKTAKRIIIELKDKLTDCIADDLPEEENLNNSPYVDDAIKALIALGYNRNIIIQNINKIIKDNNDLETAELIKKVLSRIGN